MTANPLFNPIVPQARFHPNFALLRAEAGSEPTRLMMEEVFASMTSVDGNFAEQFQTTGFDAPSLPMLSETPIFPEFSVRG